MKRKTAVRLNNRHLEYDPEDTSAFMFARDGGSEFTGDERAVCRALRKAWEDVLTPRQKKYMELYFRRRMTVYEIARSEQVHFTTVARTLRRAKARLCSVLKYYIS